MKPGSSTVLAAVIVVSFSLTAPKKKHDQLCAQLVNQPAISQLLTFRDPEDD